MRYQELIKKDQQRFTLEELTAELKKRITDVLKTNRYSAIRNKKDEVLKFQFQLRKAQCNQGFFNCPVAYMEAFGNDNERIEIFCGTHAALIEGYINRSAHKTNTPRIMGGSQLAYWFNNSKNIGDQIEVTVISPNCIFIE